MRAVLTQAATVAILLGFVLLSPRVSVGQTVTAIPKLDLNRLTGLWYEEAHLPNKWERRCLGDTTVIYALKDKPNTFSKGTFCKVKGNNYDEHDDAGKMDKSGDGKLKLSHLVLLSKKDWVLATGPSFEWALVGSPNRKALAVLSRTPLLAPDVYTAILAQASADGFSMGKLVTNSQHH